MSNHVARQRRRRSPAAAASRRRVAASLKRRYAAERRFRCYGLAAIVFAIACLVVLLFTIIRTADPGVHPDDDPARRHALSAGDRPGRDARSADALAAPTTRR